MPLRPLISEDWYETVVDYRKRAIYRNLDTICWSNPLFVLYDEGKTGIGRLPSS